MHVAVWCRRVGTATALGAAATALTASPAQAHALGPGVTAMNYRTTVGAVVPRVAGVAVRVIDDGMYVVARNDTTTPLTIDGYDGEAYLRVDAAGVWENVRSPAVYLNARLTPGAVPRIADATATPHWRRISGSSSAVWHDHRLHWMGAAPPPQVQRDPDRYNLISQWTIKGRYGDRPFRVTGALAWVPPPNPTGWLLGLAALAAGVAVLAVRRRAVLGAAMAALAVSDALRAGGLVAGRGGSWWLRLDAIPVRGVADLCACVLLLAAAGPLRQRAFAAYAAILGGVAVLLLGSSVSLPTLWRSQVLAWHPWWVERALVVASAGLATAVVIAGAVQVRREAATTTGWAFLPGPG